MIGGQGWGPPARWGRVAQVGNFGPEHSTENELRKALEYRGHQVTLYQENDPGAFLRLADRISEYDWVLWTRTGWDPPVSDSEQYRMLLAAERADVPTVGYHLDRWFGLKRSSIVDQAPFFRSWLVITADGGHPDEFAAAGVNHAWLPPAVSEFECLPGTPRDSYRSQLAFVGSWRPGYHREWQHRPQLVQWLQDNYGGQVQFWPKAGQHAIRGADLRDLYASVDVIVGDSCLVDSPRRYWSDRVPETTGRGGFLLHPHVDGLEHEHPHVVQWPAGDWDRLRHCIDTYLAEHDTRETLRQQQREETLLHHTYTQRMRTVVIWLEQAR